MIRICNIDKEEREKLYLIKFEILLRGELKDELIVKEIALLSL